MIKELREKAARALKQAQDLLNSRKGQPWGPEDETQYSGYMAEFSAAQKDIQFQERLEGAEKLAQEWLKPATPPPTVSAEAPREGNLKKAHREAFSVYLRQDYPGFTNYAAKQQFVQPQELHALVSNDNTLGGFLVPDDFRAEVLKAEAGYAVLVGLCRIETTSRDALVFPRMTAHATDQRRTSGFAGTWRQQGYVTGGTAPTVQNYPKFQQERIAVHSWQPDAVEISPELLEDSAANVEVIVAQAIGECLGFDKDDAILNGSTVVGPEGILQAGVTTVASQSATALTYSGLLAMYTNLPAQYRANSTWVMSSKTMGALLNLNTGTGGVYLWPPNDWNETILGRPVRFLDYGMDEPTDAGVFTAAEKPIIFGDWKRYIIAQRADLRIQRLVERFAPNVGFLPTARLGGQCVLTDAFRIQTIAA